MSIPSSVTELPPVEDAEAVADEAAETAETAGVAPAPAPPVIELRNVGVCYQRKKGLFTRRSAGLWALEDVSLELHRGETLGIVGRNGAGKSTLLRLLAGITRPDRGTVINHGYRATLLSLQAGFVPHLTGRENVILSAMLLGLSRREILARMDDIVRFAELEESIDEPIGTYSTGMKARLGFSTAFHVDPQVFLLDEVLGVGDAGFVKKSTSAMNDRIRSDKTVVLVSHNGAVVRSLCDRLVWIEHGRVQAEGETREVLARYETHVKRQSR